MAQATQVRAAYKSQYQSTPPSFAIQYRIAKVEVAVVVMVPVEAVVQLVLEMVVMAPME